MLKTLQPLHLLQIVNLDFVQVSATNKLMHVRVGERI